MYKEEEADEKKKYIEELGEQKEGPEGQGGGCATISSPSLGWIVLLVVGHEYGVPPLHQQADVFRQLLHLPSGHLAHPCQQSVHNFSSSLSSL